MSDATSTPDPEGASDSPAADHPGAPRWVKVFVALAVLVVLAVGVKLLVGGGHGPGRHLGGGESARTQPAGGTHAPPPGGHS